MLKCMDQTWNVGATGILFVRDVCLRNFHCFD